MVQTYVVQVLTGQEKAVKHLIDKIVDPQLVQECFIPYFKFKNACKGSGSS